MIIEVITISVYHPRLHLCVAIVYGDRDCCGRLGYRVDCHIADGDVESPELFESRPVAGRIDGAEYVVLAGIEVIDSDRATMCVHGYPFAGGGVAQVNVAQFRKIHSDVGDRRLAILPFQGVGSRSDGE